MHRQKLPRLNRNKSFRSIFSSVLSSEGTDFFVSGSDCPSCFRCGDPELLLLMLPEFRTAAFQCPLKAEDGPCTSFFIAGRHALLFSSVVDMKKPGRTFGAAGRMNSKTYIQKNQFNSAMLSLHRRKLLRSFLSVLVRSCCVSSSPQAKTPIPRMLASR